MEEEIEYNVSISNLAEGISTGSLKHEEKIKEVRIRHDNRQGRDTISVWINNELAFRYDPNSKGAITDHIQEVD